MWYFLAFIAGGSVGFLACSLLTNAAASAWQRVVR